MFGKTVEDLQENVVVNKNTITGTLKYVDDYTGFSSNVEEQTGNYLVIHSAVVENVPATITVTVTNPTVLDSDGISVLRIRDKDSQTVTVVASAEGYKPATKIFTLTGLTCEVENGQG